MFDVIGIGNGGIKQTKKGGFIRKFLIDAADGTKEVITVHAQELKTLAGEGQVSIAVRSPEPFFFAVES